MKSDARNKLVLILVFLLVLAGTNFLTYSLAKNHYSNSPFTSRDAPVKPLRESSSRAEPKMDLDKGLPAGTIDPSGLVKDIQKYSNKEVSVRGLITQNNNGYSIIDQGEDRATSVRLDTASISPETLNKYSFSGASVDVRGDQVTIAPATVTGVLQSTIGADGRISNIVLVAKSINR